MSHDRSHHSTETAIIFVLDDLLVTLDDHRPILLSLLVCSAAFNLVNHPILRCHLKHCLGISNVVYEWFLSYLSDHSQCVAISNVTSPASPLTCSVPQGLVLGPILFTIYTLTLGDIIRSHHTCFYQYTDDSQLYLACDNSESSSTEDALSKLETCIDDIRRLRPNNRLKLNDSKTEFLFIHSKFGKHPANPTITISQDKIPPAPTTRNLRVLFDEYLTLKPHVASLCKSAFFQIHQIGRIRKFLPTPTAKTVVHSIVTSRLDYCNGALAGLPDCDIAKLQSAQNTATHLISLTKKHDHITPILIELHWLPVCQCILFKVLVIMYKAINGLALYYISELINIHTPNRSTLLSQTPPVCPLLQDHLLWIQGFL